MATATKTKKSTASLDTLSADEQQAIDDARAARAKAIQVLRDVVGPLATGKMVDEKTVKAALAEIGWVADDLRHLVVMRQAATSAAEKVKDVDILALQAELKRRREANEQERLAVCQLQGDIRRAMSIEGQARLNEQTITQAFAKLELAMDG